MAASLTELLQTLGLRKIFVPPSLDGEVDQVSGWVFGTRDDGRDLYEFFAYVQEAVTTNVDDYLLLGQAGHGVQSYAMHYYLVEGQLALFLQMAWGGAYADGDIDRAAIAEQFALIPQLYTVVLESEIPPGERLVVALSDMHGSRWAILPDVMSREEFTHFGDWQTEDGVDLTSVLDWLNEESFA